MDSRHATWSAGARTSIRSAGAPTPVSPAVNDAVLGPRPPKYPPPLWSAGASQPRDVAGSVDPGPSARSAGASKPVSFPVK